ncbi:pseudouridine synthase [Aquibium sp. A9E412]|uniref:pseudouridine synthase n=1 Tax=Aquibium sp. A9E412 TaxID=2976767 RepID=UPI0025B05FA1|nr:pseudouridine synthase [Aquibium sp. A9E412]MDN2566252.1 pseudouridine synthase [Aquibium sp. A9E412]
MTDRTDDRKTRKPQRGPAGPKRGGRDAAAAKRGAGAVPAGPAPAGERIAKRLARAGVASRRDAEAMIAAGRVTLNGRVLDTPAVTVGPDDRIAVDGAPIPAIERTRLFLFHKPTDCVTTTRDPEGRRTIFDLLPPDLPRLITVGRLDMNTEGLLLLTNDGGLARVLELPETGWLRRYRVRVHGRVDPDRLAALAEGIAVDGVYYGAIEATLDREQGANAWLTLGLREGKNREVKNVLGALGLDVTRLIRVSYGPFQLGALPSGAVQEVRGRTLRDQLGERLVAEAGANFEAPVATPFSNRPVRGGERSAPPAGAAARDAGPSRPPQNAKRRREQKREEALGRLQTRPGAPREPRRGRETERPAAMPRSRASNVWMAPGARPSGPKAQAEPERPETGRARGPGRPPARAATPDRAGPAGKAKERAGPRGRPADRDPAARDAGPGRKGGKPSPSRGPRPAAGRTGPAGGYKGKPEGERKPGAGGYKARPEGGAGGYKGGSEGAAGGYKGRSEGGGYKGRPGGKPRSGAGGGKGKPAGGPRGGPGGGKPAGGGRPAGGRGRPANKPPRGR